MASERPLLSLADLEAYDPHGGRSGGANRRYLCPLCGDAKKRDSAHRSLSLESANGLWHCWRCDARGQLVEHRANRNEQSAKERAKIGRSRLSELSPIGSNSTSLDEDFRQWRERLANLESLESTPGAAYLEGRSIPVDVATLAGVRFAPDWFGRAAVVFPVRDWNNALVAAQGRHTTGDGKITCGPKSRGVFFAPSSLDVGADAMAVFHPLDTNSPGVIVCEAPIDALSLATCGFPALALCGVNGVHTTGPPWFHLACGFKRVLLAFDGDRAGDEAADALAAKLGPFGARCERLRPEGAKDWNEVLQTQGCDALADWLQVQANT